MSSGSSIARTERAAGCSTGSALPDDPTTPDMAWVLKAETGSAEHARRAQVYESAQAALELARENAKHACQRESRLRRHKALETGAEPAQLEIWPEPVRKVPVALMRSALFAVTNARKARTTYSGFTPISATKDVQLSYKGDTLTQADLTIWMEDLHLARGQPLFRNAVRYVPRQFLRSIGLTDGKDNYKNLWESQRRLRSAAIHIETKRFEWEGSLVLEVMREREDDDKGMTRLLLSPTLVEMFDKSDAWHHWQQRIAVRRDPLAQRLMALWATFADPLPYSTERLFELAGLSDRSATSRRQKLRRVCELLKEVGFLEHYHFDNTKDTLKPFRAPVQLSASAG
jgi:hypothetical protein